MSEEELVFLIAVTVVMPVLALWIILNYQKARLKIKREQPDQSLTTSELSSIIEESVEAATAPLQDRMARLEEQLQAPVPTGLLDRTGLDLDEAGEGPIKTLGRTRS